MQFIAVLLPLLRFLLHVTGMPLWLLLSCQTRSLGLWYIHFSGLAREQEMKI